MFFLYADLRTSSKWEANVVISKKDHWMALPMDRVAESGLTITVKHSKIKTTEFQTIHALLSCCCNMENSATSTLTPEQRERIEQNRLKALEKLKTKRKATDVAETGSSDDVKKPLPKRSRWTKYYEYDLSTMVDSKAGFIVEDTLEDDKVKSRREETAKIVQFIRMLSYLSAGQSGNNWALTWPFCAISSNVCRSDRESKMPGLWFHGY